MALFEIPDQVVKNIVTLLTNVQIKGGEWRAMAEIERCLSTPLDPKTLKPALEVPAKIPQVSPSAQAVPVKDKQKEAPADPAVPE